MTFNTLLNFEHWKSVVFFLEIVHEVFIHFNHLCNNYVKEVSAFVYKSLSHKYGIFF